MPEHYLNFNQMYTYPKEAIMDVRYKGIPSDYCGQK